MRNSAAIAAAVLACVSGAQAVDIETVTVGNAGNAGEQSRLRPYGDETYYGGVDYTYSIGKYEVTAGQYAEFLNAVARIDTYRLYTRSMNSHSYGCQITWNAGDSTYDFSGRPSGTEADWVNRPVNYVSWADAARFCNWLHNGQPTGTLTGDPTQDAWLTEDGSYFLNGANSNMALRDITREPDATWVIPTEDEWYKAAYHKDDGLTDNYWRYPTSSDSVPSNHLDGSGNNATFDNYTTRDDEYTIGSPYWRTEVGAHVNSKSPYGTFDQGGNVFEWNEAVIDWSRAMRGGSFLNTDYALQAALRYYLTPMYELERLGFRVARICLGPDTDGDLVSDTCDNCPDDFNTVQDDTDLDGVGDACDNCPNTLAPMGVDIQGRSLGDLNFDCVVDLDDFASFAVCFVGSSVTTPPAACPPSDFSKADLDGDGDVDLNDFNTFAANFTG